MRVRPLRPQDVKIATELLSQLGYQMSSGELTSRIARVVADTGHFAAVADDEGKILGMIHAFERPALEKPCEAVVQSLVVDGRARKVGVGRKLMAAAQAWAQERGL